MRFSVVLFVFTITAIPSFAIVVDVRAVSVSLSSDGQAVISKEGYVPVSENAAYAGTKPEGKITA